LTHIYNKYKDFIINFIVDFIFYAKPKDCKIVGAGVGAGVALDIILDDFEVLLREVLLGDLLDFPLLFFGLQYKRDALFNTSFNLP
jgi:hypothetical protein